MALRQDGKEEAAAAAMAPQSQYAASLPLPLFAASGPAVAPSPHRSLRLPAAAALPSDAAVSGVPGLSTSTSVALPAAATSTPQRPEGPMEQRRDSSPPQQGPRSPQHRPVLPVPTAAASPLTASPHSRSTSLVLPPPSFGTQQHLQGQQEDARQQRRRQEEGRKQEEQEWQQPDWQTSQRRLPGGRGRSMDLATGRAGITDSITGYEAAAAPAARRWTSAAPAAKQLLGLPRIGSSGRASRGVSSAMVAPDGKKMATAFTAAAAAGHGARTQGLRPSPGEDAAEAGAAAAMGSPTNLRNTRSSAAQASAGGLLTHAPHQPLASAAQQEKQPSFLVQQRHSFPAQLQQQTLVEEEQYPVLLQKPVLSQQPPHLQSTEVVRTASAGSLPVAAFGSATHPSEKEEVGAAGVGRWTTASGYSVAAEEQQHSRRPSSSTAAPCFGWRDSIARTSATSPAPLPVAAAVTAANCVQDTRGSFLLPPRAVAAGDFHASPACASAARRASAPIPAAALSPAGGVSPTAAASFRCPYCRRCIPLPALQDFLHASRFAAPPAARRHSSSSGAAAEESTLTQSVSLSAAYRPTPPTHAKNRRFTTGAGSVSPTQSQWGVEAAFVPYSKEQQDAAAATAAAITATLAEAERRGQVKAWGPLPLSFFCSPYNTQRWLRPP